MRSWTSRAALLTALAAPLLSSGGCGGRQDDAPAPTDRSAWKSTFEAAMDALARLDYRALLRLLSPEGRVALDEDLRLFGKMLADPLEGPRVLTKVRGRWPEVPDALIESARGGSVEDAWTLFLRAATPPGVRPEQAGMYVEKGPQEELQLLYRYGEGTSNLLPIHLRRIRGQWFVDKIALGSPAR